VPGATLDAGALIALDRNDRRVLAILARARERGLTVTIPASALTQAVRRPERQTRLSRLIRQPSTVVRALDRIDAISVGRLLGSSGTVDIADAHVVICARRAGQPIVTSDAVDLRILDPNIELFEI
jgi:predicted nucleic acid-binding protein